MTRPSIGSSITWASCLLVVAISVDSETYCFVWAFIPSKLEMPNFFEYGLSHSQQILSYLLICRWIDW